MNKNLRKIIYRKLRNESIAYIDAVYEEFMYRYEEKLT